MAHDIFDSRRIQKARQELAVLRDEWLARPGVTAVDVGYKFKDRQRTPKLALRAHVRLKRPLESLSEEERFTATARLRDQNLDVDVLEAEYAAVEHPTVALEGEAVDRTDRLRPLFGGISVGNPRISAGTLGAVVWDRTDGRPCLLSNHHVLAGSPDAEPGEAVLQPGPADGGTDADRVAVLKRMCLDEDGDVALAELSGDRDYCIWQLALGCPVLGVAEPRLGETVTKSGRGSGVTRGMIDGVALSVTLDFEGRQQTLHDQVHIVPPTGRLGAEVSRPGDSGSVWIDWKGEAVALHFAGESETHPFSEFALASPMLRLAEKMQFSFTPVWVDAQGEAHDVVSQPTRYRGLASARARPVGIPITEPVGIPITEPVGIPITEVLAAALRDGDTLTEALADAALADTVVELAREIRKVRLAAYGDSPEIEPVGIPITEALAVEAAS